MTRLFKCLGIGLLSILLVSCSTFQNRPDASRGANKYLWDASIDTLSFLPLEQADPFSGLLVTGWGTAPGASQQYKVTVFVAGAALDATSLKVAVFRRSGGGQVPASSATVSEVENAILSRARQLRISDARG